MPPTRQGVVIIPDNGSHSSNFQIVGSGSYLDGNVCVFSQGPFTSGRLNGNGCTLTNFSIDPVNIRVGSYVSGSPNGTILEYVFPLSEWDAFSTGTATTATRYTQVFSNGTWVSTSATDTITIQGTTTVNSRNFVNSFSFVELN